MASALPASTKPSSTSSTSSTSNHHTLQPLLIKPSHLRLDVLPFAVLYLLVTVLSSPLSVSDDDCLLFPTAYSQALFYRVSFLLLLLCHVFVILGQEWSNDFKKTVGFWTLKPSTATTATLTNSDIGRPRFTHVLVSPPPNSGSAQIVPLQIVQDPTDLTRIDYQVTFQQQTFRSPPLSNPPSFTLPSFPTNLPLPSYTAYIHSPPLTTRSSLITSLSTHGSNTKTLPLPPHSTLHHQQLTQPFFVFQVLCCLLWSLDEHWYYAIFTLMMLIFFETTVAVQRRRGMEKVSFSAIGLSGD